MCDNNIRRELDERLFANCNNDHVDLQIHEGRQLLNMVNFKMIDTAVMGIRRVYSIQREKLFPMPDYDAASEKEQNVIGTRIAQLRKEKGLSLAALSRLLGEYGLGIQCTGLSRWESGDAVPNAYQLVALCCAFGVEAVDYFTGQQKRPPELNQEGRNKLAEYKADLIATGKYRPNPQPISKLQYIEMALRQISPQGQTTIVYDSRYRS